MTVSVLDQASPASGTQFDRTVTLTAGGTCIACIRTGNATTVTVAFSDGSHSFTRYPTDANGYDQSGGGREAFFVLQNAPGGSATVRYTLSAAGAPRLMILEVPDAATSSVNVSLLGTLANVNTAGYFNNAGSGTAWTGGALTTTQSVAEIIGLFSGSANQAFTASSPWSVVGQEPASGSARLGVVHQRVTSTGSYNAAITASASTAWIGATIAIALSIPSRTVAGSQDPATGTLTYTQPGRVLGNQPNATGTLTNDRSRVAHDTHGYAGGRYSTQTPHAQKIAYPLTVAGIGGRSTSTFFHGPMRLLSGTQPNATGAITNSTGRVRSLSGTQPNATGALAWITGRRRSMTGAQDPATGVLSQIFHALRSLAGTQPFATGQLLGVRFSTRTVAGSEPNATGVLSAIKIVARVVNGSQDAATGVLSHLWHTSRVLAGNEPTPTGALVSIPLHFRAPVGTQPNATGTLSTAGAGPRLRDLAGDEPFAAGALARLAAFLRAFSGTQPNPTGTAIAQKITSRAVAGSQPTASGALAGTGIRARSISGNQTEASGVLARLAHLHLAPSGAQPFATGALSRSKFFARTLAGDQPSATGEGGGETGKRTLPGANQDPATGVLVVHRTAVRSMAGNQPGASGTARSNHAQSGNQPPAIGSLVAHQTGRFTWHARVVDRWRARIIPR